MSGGLPPGGGGFTLRQLVPNLCTFIAACAGLTAIRMATEQHYAWALAAIIAAALLDAIDGQLARALNAQSKFGEEFDSLADFVNFGVAPAILLFSWGLPEWSGLGWGVAMVFALCCGIRLARFNSMIDSKRHEWQKDFFTGVPAPMGAVVVLLPLYLEGLFGGSAASSASSSSWATSAIVFCTLLTAFLMVSTIPTYSGKLVTGRLAKEHPLPMLAVLAGGVLLLLKFPYATLATVTVLYLCMIPWSVWRYRQLEATTQET